MTTNDDPTPGLVVELRVRLLELRRVFPGADAWLTVAALHTDPPAFAGLLAMLEQTLAERLAAPAPTDTTSDAT